MDYDAGKGITMTRIIHISDTHFTSSHRTLDSDYLIDSQNSALRSDQLAGYLTANKKLLDSSTVVITGDVTDSGDESDYKIAKDFIARLVAAGFEVHVVPGNHDYSKEGNLRFGQHELLCAKSRYDHFVQYLAPGVTYPYCKQIGDTFLVALDSLQGEFTGKPDDCAQGRLGVNQLAALKQLIDELQPQRAAKQKVVVCLHHSPFHLTKGVPLSTMTLDGTGGLDDAKELLAIVENRIDGLLFGHTSPAGVLQQGLPDFAIHQAVHGIALINCENLEHIAWCAETPLGGEATQICSALNRDGRLTVFYVGTDGKVRHNCQAPTPGWKGQTELGGWAKQLCVGQAADGGLHLVYVGTNDRLYQNRQTVKTMAFEGETEVGGSARQVCMGLNTDGRLELFYVGMDGHIYHNRQTSPNGDWAGAARLAGLARSICVARHPDGRLEIFYIGANGSLFRNPQKAPSGAFLGEIPLGGEAVQLCVGQNADGRLEVCYVGTNGHLYHNWEKRPNGDWAGEQDFDGASAREVCVERNADGRLEILYIGTDRCIYHNFQVAPGARWAGEELLERPIDRATRLCVGKNADGRLEIFYAGTNAHLYHNWQTIPSAAYPITVLDLDQGRREVYTTSCTTPVTT